ncbi:MAG: sulfatase-like hydrolase/transferase [Balneolaceae bacterium]|nr:sulfatase-like hydrolase/transferase [Balneolaceae bacterium]
MDTNTTSNIGDLSRRFFVLYCASLTAMIIGRSYEILLGIWNFGVDFFSVSYLWFGLIQDLQFSFFLALLFLGIGWFLSLWFQVDRKNLFLAHGIAIAALLEFMLISYFGATQIPMGAEFWAYSLTEMTNTVIAAEQLTIFVGVGLVVVYLLVFITAKQILSAESLLSLSFKTMVGSFSMAGILLIATWIFSSTDTVSAIQEEKYSNKLSYFIGRGFAAADWGIFSTQAEISDEYPLLKVANYENNVLGPFFEDFEEPPNIVFLLVESLGGEFIGPSGRWTGFAPYLDSLSQQALYWENGLSLSGRTFGFIPSLLGSLPFGENGFMALGPDYPRHQSLISILAQRDYYTAFYSGYDTYFDGLDFFLDYQGIDYVLNKRKLEKMLPNKSGENYWGIDDKTMLNFAATLSDTLGKDPRLEIYHTLQSHSPFTVPNAEKYEKQFDEQLEAINISEEKKRSFEQYRNEFTTLLFADQALRDFMTIYKKKPRFENTIFVITGDHWLIPVPQTSAISRYHVPIIIYSPKLKNPVRFKSVNTHADIAPSLVALLDQNTGLDMPSLVHWLGGTLDTTKTFQSLKSVPLMRNKNRISDYLDENHYLFGDDLFELTEGLGLNSINDTTIKSQVRQKLQRFKSINTYVVENDKLYKGRIVKVANKYAFLSKYDTLYARLDSLELSIDEQFQRARQEAFGGQYETARAIAKRILLETPNYYDVQILIGRTHAWEGSYQKAANNFKEVLKKDSTYYDTYNAYFDNEYWQGDYNRALEIINNGLKYHPETKEFLERKIKALSSLHKYRQAELVYKKLKELAPDDTSLPELKKYLDK